MVDKHLENFNLVAPVLKAVWDGKVVSFKMFSPEAGEGVLRNVIPANPASGGCV